MKKLIGFIDKLTNINKRPYYGFVQGHSHLTDGQVKDLGRLVESDSSQNTDAFERDFANYLGFKNATSFASGRMGFYALLESLEVQAGDEVILTGSTCAVMVNAVLRIGARPIYADVSAKTFGTCPQSVKSLISSKTRVIVAQHSFGIPCEIEEILEIARGNQIFLIEDCALSFDSSLNGVSLGLFGDASLFSFDHTKPINAMIGGMICTNSDLDKKLKLIKENSGEIPLNKRRLLYNKFKSERALCNPSKFSKFQFLELIDSKFRKTFDMQTPFLVDDSTSNFDKISSYPYPAKMPEFISSLGRIELKRWNLVKKERQEIAKKYINFLSGLGLKSEIDSIYDKENQTIIPLRFVWSQMDGTKFRKNMQEILQIERTWFTKPIVDTNEKLENFHYQAGSCPVSESLGKTIVNLPTAISSNEADLLIDKMTLLIKQNIE